MWIAPSKRDEIKTAIMEYIKVQRLPPGARLISQAAMAKRFKTTLLTVHRAIGELVADGVLATREKVGTFIADPPRMAIAKQRITLILPGENLDQPQCNPEYWPYVQTILRAFIRYAGVEWSFSPVAVASAADAEKVSSELADCAAVFFLHQQDEWGLFNRLIRKKIAPVVCLGLPHHSRPCLSVDHDRINGGRVAVEHLISLGYRRIGFVGSREFWGEMSLEGYKNALHAAGLKIEAKRIVRIGETRVEGAIGAARLLKQAKDCEAIFADSDLHALGVFDYLISRHRIPDDIGIIGYDGLDLAVNQSPYLASVRIPWEKMISAAMEEITQRGDVAAPAKHISLLGEVIPGKTLRRVEAKQCAHE